MNTQPTRAPQEHPTPTTWKRRWYRLRYRFLRRIARLLRMPRPLDMNQALKNQRWEGFQEARDHYLGHCPYHPEELTLETGWGFRKCCLCWDEDYFRSLDSGPITDPHQPADLPTGTRLFQHLDKTRKLVGPETQEHRATWPKEKRG